MGKVKVNILLLVYVLGLLWQFLYFGIYMQDPNGHMVGFGGDPFVIYTDMLNHICNGSGTHLTFMNYPYGESIFLTDMQASFTLVFQWVSNNIYDLCDVIPGLVHGTILLLMPMAAVFLFMIFRRFDVRLVVAVIASLLIAYLAPQIFRWRGQLSLPYPFLVPMSLYWVLDLYDRNRLHWKDLLFGFVLFFFTLNNAYTGLIANASLLASGLLLLLMKDWKRGLRILCGGLIPLLLAYVIIQYSDPFDDRLKLQWGTFHYNMNFQGLFYPQGSLLYDFIDSFSPLKTDTVGKRNNLGIFVIILWLVVGLFAGLRFISKKSIVWPARKLLITIGAGTLCLLYAMNTNLVPISQDFLEQHMQVLLMFKASGRLAWVSYFAFGIGGVVLFERLWVSSQKKVMFLSVFAIASLLGVYEVDQYLRWTTVKGGHDNHLQKKEIVTELQALDLENYEAIYSLPPMQLWNDKIRLPEVWSAQYSGLILSAKTGIPLINSMLSRGPVGSMASSIAVSSYPVLPKPRLEELPLQKPILLLKGDKHELTVGEQYLIDNSTKVGRFLKADLYSLQQGLQPWKPVLPDSTAVYFHRDYDQETSPEVMLGTGALTVAGGETNILEVESLAYEEGTDLTLSVWYFVDPASYHNPKITVKHGGQVHNFTNKGSRDYYGQWRRHEVVIPYVGGNLTIDSKCKIEHYLDDLHIQATADTTYFTSESGLLFYNGYPTE